MGAGWKEALSGARDALEGRGRRLEDILASAQRRLADPESEHK